MTMMDRTVINVKTILIVFGVLLLHATPFAQSDDPLSGRWGAEGAAFLVLKFDGTRAVSGTVILRAKGQANRTPIKTGTFDPKTRALKIEGEGESPDGTKGKYVIEATVDGDSMKGTFDFGGSKQNFVFTRLPARRPTQEVGDRGRLE